jgi:hypothetical protein
MLCAVCDSDSTWHRGKINQLDKNSDQAEVVLLDIGISISTSTSNIRPLHARFVDIPCRTIPCRLRGIGPFFENQEPNWKVFNAKIKDLFEGLRSFQLTASFKFILGLEEMFVEVKCKDNGVSVVLAEALIQQGHGVQMSDDDLKDIIQASKDSFCHLHRSTSETSTTSQSKSISRPSQPSSATGEFHDQGNAKWIVIRRLLCVHNNTPCMRPSPGWPIGRLGSVRPQGVIGVF